MTERDNRNIMASASSILSGWNIPIPESTKEMARVNIKRYVNGDVSDLYAMLGL